MPRLGGGVRGEGGGWRCGHWCLEDVICQLVDWIKSVCLCLQVPKIIKTALRDQTVFQPFGSRLKILMKSSLLVGVEKLQGHAFLVMNLDFPLFTLNRIYLYSIYKVIRNFLEAFEKALCFLGSRLILFPPFLKRFGFISFLWLVCFVLMSLP